MRTLKDDQFDRCKVEVQQCMELKHTNSPIAFLCPYHAVYACMNRGDEVDLTSNWCVSHINRASINLL